MLLKPSTRRRDARSVTASVAIHLLVGAAILGLLYRHPARVFNPPGTLSGTHIELVYLPGRAAASSLSLPTKLKAKPVAERTPSWIAHTSAQVLPSLPLPPRPQVTLTPAAPTVNTSAPPSDAPNPTNGSNSWGPGEAQQIALTTYSPSPLPDLSVLPRGTEGDVIVDITINADGSVSDPVVLKTLGYGIESSVISTVRTWTFRPATKDGVPIASMQELEFHFRHVR